MDLAVDAKAQEMVSKNLQDSPMYVLRLGAFYITMAVLAVLGKRSDDAGLSDLVIEAGIVAAGSIQPCSTRVAPLQSCHAGT